LHTFSYTNLQQSVPKGHACVFGQQNNEVFTNFFKVKPKNLKSCGTKVVSNDDAHLSIPKLQKKLKKKTIFMRNDPKTQ
jgi:hypothetical protein